MSIILTIAITLVVVMLLAICFGRFLFRPSGPFPCYRCAVEATTEYMGLHYCMMCRAVVIQMLPGVRHDPPYGFPGASGYLDFLVEEKKKES